MLTFAVCQDMGDENREVVGRGACTVTTGICLVHSKVSGDLMVVQCC